MATITTLPAFPLRDLYCFQSIGIRLPDSELTTVCVCGAASRLVQLRVLLRSDSFGNSVRSVCEDFLPRYRRTANIASAKTKEPFSAWLVLGWHPRDCFGA